MVIMIISPFKIIIFTFVINNIVIIITSIYHYYPYY